MKPSLKICDMLRHLTAASLCLFAFWSASARTVRVHTQDEMNRTPHQLNSHAGEEKYSSLEPIYRYTSVLKPSALIPGTVPVEQRNPWYPRIKSLPDGTYIMTYQGGQVSSRTFSSFSSDLLHWTMGKVTSTPQKVTVDGAEDYTRMSGFETAVLSNGTLLGVRSVRSTNAYKKTGAGCGIDCMRSHDNGRTWTRPIRIYEGPNWEPYILELPDSTVQVYFTDTNPVLGSSCTSVLESRDGGVNFGPKSIVCRQFKYYDNSLRVYTDQMPVFRLLNDGKTLFGIVESRLEEEGPGTPSSYYISLVRNPSARWEPLSAAKEGPADKQKNILRANSGYVVTLPSGEVVISTGIEGRHSVKLGNSTATEWNGRNFASDWLQPFDLRGCWGSIEATADKHHIISCMDSGENGICLALSYLNHRITAPLQQTTLDGDCGEWLGDEALFIGSDSPVETIFRASHDGKDLFIAVEIVGEQAQESKINLKLCVEGAKLKKGSYADVAISGGKLDNASVEGVRLQASAGFTSDNRKGFVYELALPLASIGAVQTSALCFWASVDGDSFFNVSAKNPSTWQRITLSGEKLPVPFHTSHRGYEQYSRLQPMPAYSGQLDSGRMLKGVPPSAKEQQFCCYPRIKKMANGSYIMFYMGGRFGSRIWCSVSPDFKEWSEPQMLFSPYRVAMEDGTTDVRRFVNPDALVLPDGEIILICSFRAAAHYSKGQGSGLMIRRSKDNGQTWSEPYQISDVCNWEPYLLLLPDGRIQCYLTHGVPQYWNSGTSVMTSEDGGYTWSAPMRCCRQYKYDYQGQKIFTDQMPCFRLLADGKTLVGWMEARLETKVPLDYKDKNYFASYCKMSLVYNDGTDWKDLGENTAGPSRRHSNVDKGAGGYVVTFPSGEVVIGCGKNSIYRMKLLDSDAQLVRGDNWQDNWTAALPGKGYWGTMEVDGPQSLVCAMHEDKTGGIQLARFWLNHALFAPQGGMSEDCFHLSTKEAQLEIRAGRYDADLVLATALEGKFKSAEIKLCARGSKKYKSVKVEAGDARISIPLQELEGLSSGDEVCIFASLTSDYNTATFTGTKITDSNTWQRIVLK